MDKNKLKIFAIESRKKLIEDVKHKAKLIGVDKEISNPFSSAEGMETYENMGQTYTIYGEDIEKRKNLVKQVTERGYDEIIEEVAYTWFNRIIAIRYLEVNNYLPTKIRVLSSEIDGKTEPDIITESPNIDLDFTNEDKEKIYNLKNDNKTDDLFQFLFIKQCNKLNEILPGLFEKTEDYMELLLNISIIDQDSVINVLIKDISEEDFTNQIEIIGWLYQYYNSELKDDTFKNIKKNKVPKNRIPAATQLFTPNWIVKYMVENSLGRLWLEGHPNTDFQTKMKYYLTECEQEKDVNIELDTIRKNLKNINPEDIHIIDPCMGSGHILTYVFDILMEIYISMGYTKSDSTIKILQNNIYGLDIDNRAYQLAYFSIMMKAREYNRKILKQNITPLLYPIQESDNISMDLINSIIKENPVIKEDLLYLIDTFKNAKEYGSLINVKNLKFNELKEAIKQFTSNKLNFIYAHDINLLENILNQAILLNKKYDVVITNPPYMGSSGMTNSLKKYLKKEYHDSQRDLFAAFIEKCQKLLNDNGYKGMITQQSFMFLSSFEKLRKKFLEYNLINMIHLGAHAFEEIGGEVVQSVAFINTNYYNENYTTKFVRLTDYTKHNQKKQEFFNKNNYFLSKIKSFSKIPGNPIAYWVDKNLIDVFTNGTQLQKIADVKQGLATADNNRFLRLWFEVDFDNIGFGYKSSEETKNTNKKWYPYNKGGEYRKWYGNHEYIVNWENDGYEIRNIKGNNGKIRSRVQNSQFYFKESISWSKISSGSIAFRYYPTGFLFDVAGCSIFTDKKYQKYIFGFLNSNVSKKILELISPTLNYEVGHISSIPILYDDNAIEEIENLVSENINISKNDWDDYETSWNFKKHPLIKFNTKNIEKTYNNWTKHKHNEFNKLQTNENKLNTIYSKIYNVKTNPINEKNISLNIANLEKDIKSFISYFVGCLFGRYSLDKEGLISAGTFNIQNYKKYTPDEDNIVPILDNDYFDDDIVNRFEEFLKTCFGTEHHEENLEFIAKALKKKGKTSREIIRNYFLNDFFKDHTKTYQKRPIYWQFDSGKQNGFKCLIYMHRYTPDTLARIRTEYLHKTQKAYETQLEQQKNLLNNTSNSKDKARINNEIKKLTKQIQEIQKYDETLATLADKNIQIGLDGGVKVNYQKFQDNRKNLLTKI